ncbi:MAG: hypothetical protein HOV80_22150 [Polyangiaceae bacterium]|nr:hypothetical protein [Polyangiaceae bacterium]
MNAHECQRCGELRRAVVVHPALKNERVLWCRDCVRLQIKDWRRAALSAQGKAREEMHDIIARLRRAAEGPAYVEPDERQLDLLGGSR